MIQAPVKIDLMGNPYNSPSGFLPYLRHGSLKIAGYDQIKNHIIQQIHKTGNVFKDDLNFSSAFIEHWQTRLFPYVQYLLWGDPDNQDNTRLYYSKRIRFPFSFFCLNNYIRRSDEMAQFLENFSTKDPAVEHKVERLFYDAKVTITDMEKKFGPIIITNYLKFKELSANMYAYVVVLKNSKFLVKNSLQSHLNECPNLTKFTEVIRRLYFIDECKSGFMDDCPKLTSTNSQDIMNEGIGSNLWIKIGTAAFATSAMILFAILNGLITGFHLGSYNDYDMYMIDDDDDYEDESEN